MTGIINYGLGNLFSVEKAFGRIQQPYLIGKNSDELKNCDRYILAGVGHFGYGMEELKKNDLVTFIQDEVLEKRKPILGICLGMQLLGASSEEGSVEGLGLITDAVTKLSVHSPAKIPHIGWNTIDVVQPSDLLKDVKPQDSFYFTHSYAYQKESKNSLAMTEYGRTRFVSVVGYNSIFGVQFHPEKSFEQGLGIITNFCLL